MSSAVRASGVPAEVSMHNRSRIWTFSQARMELIGSALPIKYDPAAIVNDAAEPGTGTNQITGTIVSVNAEDLTCEIEVHPGEVFRHNIRNITGYTIYGVESTKAEYYEGSLVYFDRTNTNARLTLSANDANGVANIPFGRVVRDAEETAASFPKATAGAISTTGAAVMQFGIRS